MKITSTVFFVLVVFLTLGISQQVSAQDIILTVEGECPGVITVHVQADPDRNMALIFAMELGEVPVPLQHPCFGAVLGLGRRLIQVVEYVGLDQNGELHKDYEVGPRACRGFLQVLGMPSCRTSNVAQFP